MTGYCVVQITDTEGLFVNLKVIYLPYIVFLCGMCFGACFRYYKSVSSNIILKSRTRYMNVYDKDSLKVTSAHNEKSTSIFTKIHIMMTIYFD